MRGREAAQMQAGHRAAAYDTRFGSTMGTDQSSGKALAALASIRCRVSVQEWGAAAAHALANSAVCGGDGSVRATRAPAVHF